MRNKLETPLQKLARITSKTYGLKVVHQGSGAYVDLKNNIMSLPVIATEEMTKLIHGYLDHEVGHMKHTGTDFDFVKFCIGKSKMVEDMGRLIEDVRVDAEVAKDYLGCGENINKTRLASYAKCRELAKEAGQDREAVYQMDILEYLAGRMAKMEMCKTAVEGVEKAQDLFDKVSTLKSCKGSFELAHEIVQRWGEDTPEDQNQDGEGEDSDDSQSDGQDDGQGSGQGSDNNDDQNEDQDSGSGGNDNENEDDGDDNSGDNSGDKSDDNEGGSKGQDGDNEKDQDDGSQDSGDGSEEGEGQDDTSQNQSASGDDSGDQDENFLDKVEAMSDATKAGDSMEDMVNEMLGDIGYSDLTREHIPFSTEFDDIGVYKGKTDDSREKQIRADAKESSGMLIRRLEMALKAINRARNCYEQERGRIDARRLHALVGGTSNRVFKKRVEAETEDTAVYLLVDCSGSMCHRDYIYDGNKRKTRQRIESAQIAACAFSKCLDTLGIPNEVAGFSTGSSYGMERAYEDYKNKGGKDGYFTRCWTKINHRIVKTFDDNFEAGRFSALETWGANFDGESVMVAGRILAKRPEKRKILIVFSDGRPVEERGGRCISADDYLTKKIKEINEAGIHTIGIGIGDDCVKKYYPDHVILPGAENLSAVTIKQIERILLAGQAGKIKKEVA